MRAKHIRLARVEQAAEILGALLASRHPGALQSTTEETTVQTAPLGLTISIDAGHSAENSGDFLAVIPAGPSMGGRRGVKRLRKRPQALGAARETIQ